MPIAAVLALAAFLAMWACAPSGAQTAAPAPPGDAGALAPLGAFGDWMRQGAADVGGRFGAMAFSHANEAVKTAGDAAFTAAMNVSRLRRAGLADGRERCATAANGAPDCAAAARAMCEAKGYGSGRSVDSVAMEICPPQYRRMTRREVPQGVCAREYVVTRAWCE